MLTVVLQETDLEFVDIYLDKDLGGFLGSYKTDVGKGSVLERLCYCHLLMEVCSHV